MSAFCLKWVRNLAKLKRLWKISLPFSEHLTSERERFDLTWKMKTQSPIGPIHEPNPYFSWISRVYYLHQKEMIDCFEKKKEVYPFELDRCSKLRSWENRNLKTFSDAMKSSQFRSVYTLNSLVSPTGHHEVVGERMACLCGICAFKNVSKVQSML